MTEAEILSALEKVGAILRDTHVVYTSGKHGNAYVNKDAIYPHTLITSELCGELASRFANQRVEVVLAPAVGGVILSQWVAYHLTRMSRREVLGVYAEKTPSGDGLFVARGYDELMKGKRVLVVEDVMTTGGTVKKAVEATRTAGGLVVGVGALCNRGGITSADFGEVPLLSSLVRVQLDSWEAANCPLCAKSIPINTKVGKGKSGSKSS